MYSRHLFYISLLVYISLVACQSSKKLSKRSLYYETTMIKTPQISFKQKPQLLTTIIKALKKRSLYQGTPTKNKKIIVKRSHLEKLSFGVLKAIWIASDRKYYGAELDLKMKSKQGKPMAVSVWISRKGKMVFNRSNWPKFRTVKSAEALQKKWKIGGIKNSKQRKWSPLALNALDYALQLISDDERSLLDDIPVIRRKVNAAQRQRGALYIQEGDCDAKIVIYDLAVRSQSYQFVGTLDKIYPATTMTVLHEIGHAIHQRKLREIQCAYIKTVKRYNTIVKKGSRADQSSLAKDNKLINKYKRKMKRWSKKNPMLMAYKKVRGGNKGPTLYAHTSIKESFAEAFALYRADPQALQRIYPKVYQWFKKKKHLQHLDFSDAE